MIPDDFDFWSWIEKFVSLHGPGAGREALSSALFAHRSGNTDDASGWMTVYAAVKLLDAGYRPLKDQRN